jgi:superfamily I DNA/RNA helicase/RecB family exonuclease
MTQFILDRTPVPARSTPDFDENQLAVINHRHGAMRVLAGPGTGKTTTLVHAMASRLIGDAPLLADQVLGLTFGRKAALEWRDQVTIAVGGGKVPLVSTFHSFCYALVRKYQTVETYQEPIRLLSGPEQQQRARQLFSDAVRDGRVEWPEELQGALDTRGLAEEVRAVMSRARSHLMDPRDLVQLGKASSRDAWASIGGFMDEYLDVLDLEGVIDYTELVHRAVLLCHRPDVQADLHSSFKAIYVDEYQDTDPGQVALLKALVSPSSSLIVVGDIDQAIYGFRGADETGIRTFSDAFEKVYAKPVDDVVLRTCRRFGPHIREVAKAVIEKYHPAGFPAQILKDHRDLKCEPLSDAASKDVDADAAGDSIEQGKKDTVEVLTFDSDGAQAAHIADLLARARQTYGYAWADMAVIVRSAVVSLPAMYRAMVMAGVPVEVAADEIPLHLDPAVSPLVTALRVIDNPHALTPDVAMGLLQGPFGKLDPVDLRRFGRYLRSQDATAERAAAPSAHLIRDALADPKSLLDIPSGQFDQIVAVFTRVGEMLNGARTQMAKGASPHELMWHVWQSTAWPQELERQSVGRTGASQRANRDLDSICALFDVANRFVSRGRGKDLTNFLAEIEAQEIPGESLAEHDVRSDSVRLLTAHRAKGLQWKYVIVAGAQEDAWPDLRTRQTLLQAARIGAGQELMPPTARELLNEERRLFYVAITRAMERLVITAVDTSSRDDGTFPSRFIDDIKALLDEDKFKHISGRPVRALSVDGVIASLRQTLLDPKESPAFKEVAAAKLAQLARHSSDAFASARPENWWGINEPTINAQGPVEPLGLSPSAIDSIEECPAKWFLERQVQATSQAEMPMVFGNAIHAIAEGLQRDEIPFDMDEINQRLDRLWSGMGYETPWEARVMREQAGQVAQRLVSWLTSQGDVRSVAESGLELKTTLSVTREDGTTRDIELRINGRADRIEFQADGVVVYDFKTGKRPLEAKKVSTNIQLALYAYLIEHGNYEDADGQQHIGSDVPVKGSALVQLRNADKVATDLPIVQFAKADEHDVDSEVPLEQRLTDAAIVVLDEQYVAKYEERKCSRCPVSVICPAVPAGRSML